MRMCGVESAPTSVTTSAVGVGAFISVRSGELGSVGPVGDLSSSSSAAACVHQALSRPRLAVIWKSAVRAPAVPATRGSMNPRTVCRNPHLRCEADLLSDGGTAGWAEAAAAPSPWSSSRAVSREDNFAISTCRQAIMDSTRSRASSCLPCLGCRSAGRDSGDQIIGASSQGPRQIL